MLSLSLKGDHTSDHEHGGPCSHFSDHEHGGPCSHFQTKKTGNKIFQGSTETILQGIWAMSPVVTPGIVSICLMT
jgi:hypothetical protein